MYVFYSLYPDAHIPSNSDHIFPYFILTKLPPGISGLLIIGVFSAAMSSLDSALNALASSAVCDIYRPFLAKNRDEKHNIYKYSLYDRLNIKKSNVFWQIVDLLATRIERVGRLYF